MKHTVIKDKWQTLIITSRYGSEVVMVMDNKQCRPMARCTVEKICYKNMWHSITEAYATNLWSSGDGGKAAHE